MKILLDTHIFLWFISKDKSLSNEFKQNLRDQQNEVYLSVASVWEITIKYQLGKLPLPDKAEIYIPTQRKRHQIDSLIIDEGSIKQLAELPRQHRDPFDRIIIAQALQHDLTLATVDKKVRRYPVNLL
ncbi:MAG: type II toxin-antitoxin system VapC family toxin [Phormidesmis sp.]